MHVDAAAVRDLEWRYGIPATLAVQQPIGAEEMAMLRASRRGVRQHDLTLFIFAPDGRVALIRKHQHPPDVFRAPSGAARPREAPDEGACREAYEETGLRPRLHRYVLRVRAAFVTGGHVEPWHTHVFTARGAAGPLRPVDTAEIAEARFATPQELTTHLRRALLRTGKGLLRYRASLTDAVLAVLQRHPDLAPADLPDPRRGTRFNRS